VLAVDGGSGTAFANSDLLRLTFDAATNSPGFTGLQILQSLRFEPPLPVLQLGYNWLSNSDLEIFFTNVNASAPPPVLSQTIIRWVPPISGPLVVRNAGGFSGALPNTFYVVDGWFGT